MITLDYIDKVVERTGVTFEVAKDALDCCKGNVIEAIIQIQKQHEDDSYRARQMVYHVINFSRK